MWFTSLPLTIEHYVTLQGFIKDTVQLLKWQGIAQNIAKYTSAKDHCL